MEDVRPHLVIYPRQYECKSITVLNGLREKIFAFDKMHNLFN